MQQNIVKNKVNIILLNNDESKELDLATLSEWKHLKIPRGEGQSIVLQ